VQGCNERGEPWTVGIAHPRSPDQLIASLRLRQGSVCTSGDYERRQPSSGHEHHLMDPKSGASARQVASCTVVTERATVADALSTAAFVAGPEAGLRLLEEQQVDGLLVTPDLRIFKTAGFDRWLA